MPRRIRSASTRSRFRSVTLVANYAARALSWSLSLGLGPIVRVGSHWDFGAVFAFGAIAYSAGSSRSLRPRIGAPFAGFGAISGRAFVHRKYSGTQVVSL